MISSKAMRLRLGLARKDSLKLMKSVQERQLLTSVITPPTFSDFTVKNEPILAYDLDSKERRLLTSSLRQYLKQTVEVPIVIGGQEYKTDLVKYQVVPHDHSVKIAKFYYATPELLQKAIDVAVGAQKEWDHVPFADKFSMWLRAADLMAGAWRQKLNATTMLGQSKTLIQAEIDASAELIDFMRFNAYFAKELLKYSPVSENLDSHKNHYRYRGMEGFVAAISPFNFTAIGGNLAYTPALMGNSVLWKPSDTALLSNYEIFKIMKEVGVPPGVVNFVPCDGPTFGKAITSSPHLAGINFTGSVPTFQHLWKEVGNNLGNYKNFPRLVGECGGKNFHFVHPTADVTTVVNATIRSSFEYCGQKCSACSRIYVPASLWDRFREELMEEMDEIEVGPVTDFQVFASAVIDEKAFDRISSYIKYAEKNLKVWKGGECNKTTGYYIEPTLIETKDPKDKVMTEEIFGPVVCAYVYPDEKVNECLELLDTSTPYALTGAVFAEDEAFLKQALKTLKYASGNFYINDRSTGSVVGQQPFGGGRMSGTNDKAGGPHYVSKWTTPQTIKETYVPVSDWRYAYMDEIDENTNEK